MADAPPAPQYFSPYVSADMHKMAAAFNTTVAALEDELTQLILEGLINARIDSHSKVAGWGKAMGAGRGPEALSTVEPRPTLPPADPVCQGRGSAQHHLREVPADGEGVPETCQSDDPAGGRASQPDSRQGEGGGRPWCGEQRGGHAHTSWPEQLCLCHSPHPEKGARGS